MTRKETLPADGVIIIGAGASGLATAKEVCRRDIPVRIIERTQRAGDAWHHRHPQLRLNTHRQLSALPGLAFPKAAGAFPSRDDVITYLEDYARRLDAPIDYGVEVECIEPARSGWKISTEVGEYRARHVVVATGYDRVPTMPDWPGRDDFRGQLLHAADFGALEQYRDRKLLVVGAGNSGTDILNHLSRIDTGRVWVSVRHGPVIFPKYLCGIPMQRLSPWFSIMPVWLADTMLGLTERIAFGDLAQWGLHKHPQGGITRLLGNGTAPAIDDGFVAALKAGKVTVVPEIERFDPAGVRLVDGQYLEPDIVIAATGYSTGLEPLLVHLDVLDDAGVPKIHGKQQLKHYPGLWFTGMQPRLTGFFQLAGSNAKAIARAIERGLDSPAPSAGAFDLSELVPASRR